MSIQITDSQYSTSLQPLRNVSIRINLLNFNYLVVDNLEGNVISGNITYDANSDLRRSCTISLVVTDSSFNAQAGGKIWLDKYIQIFIGVDDIKTGETAWNNMGIYLINQPSYDYDAVTHTLTFQGVDLMAKMTGLRNGYIANLAGEDVAKATVGQNVREIMIAILAENGFTKYSISECVNTDGTIQPVPYEMEFGQGSTWYQFLNDLRNILPQYQIYFDVNGVFHYELIPIDDYAPVRINTDVWEANLISEQVSVDFEGVKNVVEVYGANHETDNFSDALVSTVTGNAIGLTITGITELMEYVMVAFALPSEATGNLTINVNNLGDHPLVDINGNPVTSLAADTYWVAVYQADDTWLFMGHSQAQAQWSDNNPASPFYVGSTIGEIRMPLYGGEYENIQTDDLALQRAKWEIYKRCRLNDTITLTTIPIYWGEVNWKVAFAPLNETAVNLYIVQSISTDIGVEGTQTWNLSRYYPEFDITGTVTEDNPFLPEILR